MPRKAAVQPVLSPDVLNHVIVRLQHLQKARRMYIKGQSRLDRATESAIASDLGYHPELPEAQRKKLAAKAIEYRKDLEKAMVAAMTDPSIVPQNPGIDDTIFIAAATFFNARRPLDRERDKVEEEMRSYAKMLPIWPWVRDNVSGLAELGLTVLVAESVGKTGTHIGNYTGPKKLWKRYGLACFNGERQGRVPAGLTKEERKEAWIKRGYNPKRRAEVYAFIDDPMFRAQWRGAKDANGKNPAISKQPMAVEAHARGPYGEVYGKRKAWNLARGLEPAHADRDARRIMAKAVIRDLWVAWHAAEASMPLAMAAE